MQDSTRDLPSSTRRSLLLAGAAMAATPCFSWAQDKYPSRPIDFIVPWGAGGGADQLARRVGKQLEDELGVSLPIINVTGATGNTGTTKLLTSEPDGYSICVFIADTLGTLAGGKGRWKLSDIEPLGIMMQQSTGLFVKQDAKWRTFQELLDDSKQRDLKVGITGFGSPDEMMTRQMNDKGSKFRVVPFAAPGERYTSILGGHADVLVEQAGDIRSFLQNKQMRPLVFFSDEPQTGYTDIPLAKDFGFPLAISQFRSLIVRAGTDPQRVATLAAAVEKVARSDEYKKSLQEELASPNSFIPAAEARAYLDNQLKLIEDNLPKKS